METNILCCFDYTSIYKSTPPLSSELNLLLPEFKSSKLYLKYVFSFLCGEKKNYMFSESFQIKLMLCSLLVNSTVSPPETVYGSLLIIYSRI